MARTTRFLSSLAVLAALAGGGLYAYRHLDLGTHVPTPKPGGIDQERFLLEHDFSCTSRTGQDTSCTGTLSSDQASTTDFHWQVSGSDGASADPESGSIAPGGTSQRISLTVPHDKGCPFTVVFVDQEHNASYQVPVHSIDGKKC
jgi:hypothetical protein